LKASLFKPASADLGRHLGQRTSAAWLFILKVEDEKPIFGGQIVAYRLVRGERKGGGGEFGVCFTREGSF
jgi:hypothetical protein